MQASKRAYEIIMKFEYDGKVPPLTAYWDKYGSVWTIGWGHTRTAKQGMEITLFQAERLLIRDVKSSVDAVNKYVKVYITQNMFDALVSFTFNVGSGALARSTLIRRLNAGDIEGAANEFLRWVYAGGEVLKGLVRRREAERNLFLDGYKNHEHGGSPL
jgi:lysozyme